MLSYQWQGIEDAMRRIGKLAAMDGLDAELEAAGDTIVSAAQVYPPERPGQRYVRTYQLRGGWKRTAARRSSRTIEVDVDNPVEYGPFVQGEDQAPIHQNRWKRLRAIGDDKRGEIRARVGAWALRTWRGG